MTFAELFLHLSEEDNRVGQWCVHKVTIVDQPGNRRGPEVDLTAPVTLCEEFNAKQQQWKQHKSGGAYQLFITTYNDK